MAATLLSSFLTGALFGAALLASNLYLPSTIISFFNTSPGHMLETYMTAIPISTLIISAANRTAYARLACRTNSSYGWFGAYDGNMIGGLLQGVGMVLAGSDPGGALVQFALGLERAGWTVFGGVLGGWVFLMIGKDMRKGGKSKGQVKGHTLAQRFGLSEGLATVGFVTVLVVVAWYFEQTRWVREPSHFRDSPVAAGLMLGGVQAVSVLLSKKTLGVSSAYPDVAGHLWSLLRGRGVDGGFSNIVLAVGVMAGARIASLYVPFAKEDIAAPGAGTAVLGGFCMIFGARLAGGCSSGHGLSGTSLLSVSSFVTVAAMFVGGLSWKWISHV